MSPLLLLVACRPDASTADTPPSHSADHSGDLPSTGDTTESGTLPTHSAAVAHSGHSAVVTSTAETGGTSTSWCSGAVVHYQADIEPIFLSCGGSEACHQLTLGRPGAAIPWLVDVPTDECSDHRMRVAPYDPENSYLVDKITNQGICSGAPMPKPLPGHAWNPLPHDDLQAVVDWICLGALDD